MSIPSLTHVADLTVEVSPPMTIGRNAAGLRRVVPIIGGCIKGPRVNGVVLAAGADYQVIHDDGFSTLDARYVVQLDSGGLLYIVNTGVRFGPKDVMDRITRGEPVDPAQVYFRTTPSFETSSPDHQWMIRPLFVATGIRHPDAVELKVFQVE